MLTCLRVYFEDNPSPPYPAQFSINRPMSFVNFERQPLSSLCQIEILRSLVILLHHNEHCFARGNGCEEVTRKSQNYGSAYFQKMGLNLTYVLKEYYQGLFYPIGFKKTLSPNKIS